MKHCLALDEGSKVFRKETIIARMFARKATSLLCLLVLLFPVAIAGCGPTTEEIAAREQARERRQTALRMQEEARKREEEVRKREEQARQEARIKVEAARLARIEAAVSAAAQAESEGRPDVAVARLLEALKDIKRYEPEVIGIGVQIAVKDGFPSVVSLSEQSPAYKAGVRVANRIVRVEGQPTQNMDFAGIVKALRGAKGAPVTVTVSAEGGDQATEYRIVRDAVYPGDREIREKIIKVVRAMKPAPALPEEAVRSMTRGDTKVRMGGTGAYAAAAAEMEQAVLAAPWNADYYFRLGMVQERAEMYGEASQNYLLYVAAAPNAPNAAAMRNKVYSLEVMQEEKEKVASLAGPWKSRGGNIYTVSVEGRRIKIDGSSPEKLANGTTQKWFYSFDLEATGNSLEGANTIAHESHSGCSFPNETVQASGTIGDGARSLKINWKNTIYSWTWQGSTCTEVNSMGIRDEVLDLVERATVGQQPAQQVSQPKPAQEQPARSRAMKRKAVSP